MIRRLLAARSFVLRASSSLAWLPLAATRAALGTVFVSSGWGKLHDLPRVIGYFESLGIPAPQLQAPFVAGVELAGGAFLLAGLFTRVASVPLAATMVVALLTARRADLASASDLFGAVELLYLLLLGSLAAFGAGALSLGALLVPGFGLAKRPGPRRDLHSPSVSLSPVPVFPSRLFPQPSAFPTTSSVTLSVLEFKESVEGMWS